MTGLPGDARDRLAAALVKLWAADAGEDVETIYGLGAALDESLSGYLDALLPVVAELADLRAAEELESAARGVMAGATEVRGLPGAVRQALTVAASVISARAAALTPTAEGDHHE